MNKIKRGLEDIFSNFHVKYKKKSMKSVRDGALGSKSARHGEREKWDKHLKREL